ncbi:DNA mismatch endonuclease Vsr [Candidatus Sumerlaeota bacterium]|nr:DNA mismatch endonuclease Vsr [Candidatus Sumerlaeota bacterium]
MPRAIKSLKRIDPLTPAQRKKTMQSVKSEDTKPEIKIRKLIFSLGYRYRLHRKDLPGKPDIVFPSRKKIIFVHGCFWHGHNCRSGQNQPKTNQKYWKAKIRKNVKRDFKNIENLKQLGWNPLIIWECEIKDAKRIKKRIKIFLKN